MSQRPSGYNRRANECYETPTWVTEALIPHIPDRIKTVWEPACGSGKIIGALAGMFRVYGTDSLNGQDFLQSHERHGDAIITNPPYNLAAEFIYHALHLTGGGGLVAMLLRTDFDHAKSRRYLFGEHKAFAKKLVLTKRIVWFEPAKASPSFNHAWFIWDWKHDGPPILTYHFEREGKAA